MLRIGQVAARSGVSVDTLRYYERLGLVPKPTRTQSGYRLYEERVVERIGFIKRAQRFGFTLEEIKRMLSLEIADPRTCEQVLKMIEHKLEDLDQQYEQLKRLRRELSAYRIACQRAIAGRKGCPVMEDLILPQRQSGGRAKKAPKRSGRKT